MKFPVGSFFLFFILVIVENSFSHKHVVENEMSTFNASLPKLRYS